MGGQMTKADLIEKMAKDAKETKAVAGIQIVMVKLLVDLKVQSSNCELGSLWI
jgi:hypothetical protein